MSFEPAYKNQIIQGSYDIPSQPQNAAVLLFPYAPTNAAKAPEMEGDIIDQRMMFPLHDDERKAISHMLQQRAKFLREELWIATENFLLDMGVESLDDLRRCDFVRAVECLVAFTASAQTRMAMQ